MEDTTWVNRTEYPFQPHHLMVDGGRMHYVDEGSGRPIVMVHGTPTWSFLYRHLIKALAPRYRCIAPDHIGFGLSDKPAGWSYRPRDHARNLRRLIERLDLRDVTLMVHDFGGPIGLSYAVEQPDNVDTLVLFNTWMWPLQESRSARTASKLASGALGKFLYTRLNFSPRVLLRALFGNKAKLTRTVHRPYTAPFPRTSDRTGPWVLARELIGSSDWYQGLWERRDRLQDKPALIAWGMRDPTFTAEHLARWRELFHTAEIVTLPQAGHVVQEEADNLAAIVTGFLDSHPHSNGTATP